MFNPYSNYYPNYNPQPTIQNASPQFMNPQTLPGMVVSDISQVGAESVPMTGKPCVFPLMDGSAVYLKMWNNQGGISTVKYVPETQTKQADNVNPDVNLIASNLNNLMNRVSRIEQGLGMKGDGTDE